MASEMAAQIGARIREARQAKGLSQKELGNLLPGVVGGDQVSKWERGEHRPYDDTLAAIARTLGVDLAYFLVVEDRTPDTPEPFAPSTDQRLARLEERLERIEAHLRELTAEQLLATMETVLDQREAAQAGNRASKRRAQGR